MTDAVTEILAERGKTHGKFTEPRMGAEFDLDKYTADRERGPSLGEIWAKEKAVRDADEARHLADARADSKAIWALADLLMPGHIDETARRWKMEGIIKEMWRSAFIAGWRAAHRNLGESS